MIPECKGCDRISKLSFDPDADDYGCVVYAHPERQHTRIGGCPMRTHNKKAIVSEDIKINPLKMSKRGIKQ